MISAILAFSIICGQFIKLPLFSGSGPILLDISVAALNLVLLLKHKFKFKNPPVSIKSALIFLIIASISLIFTPLNLSLTEYLISFSYILRFFNFILFGLLIYFAGVSLRLNLKVVFLISGIFLSLIGLLQFIFLPNLFFLAEDLWDPHYFRTVSTFLDPNFLGAFLVLSLTLLLQVGNFKFRNFWVLVSCFSICYLALLTTFSRSSYLMFFISFLSISFFKRSLKLSLLTIILSTILMLGFYLYTKEVSGPRNIDREKSAISRLSTWQQGVEVFKRSPILGVGFNSYRYAIREYNLAPTSFLTSRGSTTNDSSLLFVLATTGILGLVSFIYFLFNLYKVGFKNLKDHSLSLVYISGLNGILVHSIFNNSLFYPPILLWIILIAVQIIPKK